MSQREENEQDGTNTIEQGRFHIRTRDFAHDVSGQLVADSSRIAQKNCLPSLAAVIGGVVQAIGHAPGPFRRCL